MTDVSISEGQTRRQRIRERRAGLQGKSDKPGRRETLRIRRLGFIPPEAETEPAFQERISEIAPGEQRIPAGGEISVETKPITPGSNLTISSPRFGFVKASRGDLALSDTFEEKRAKFMEKFPNGDFQEIPGRIDLAGNQSRQSVIIFRRDQGEEFARLDRSDVDLLEIMGDVADLAGDAPAIAGEILLTRGLSGIKRFISIFFGGAGGEGLKQGIEEMRGFQRDTRAQQAQRMFTQGAVGVVGAYASRLASGPLNYMRGAPVIGLKAGAERAMKAGEVLEIPSFLPGQVTTNPLVRKLQGQAGTVLPTVGDYIINQHEASIRAIMKLRDRDVVSLLKDDLAGLQARAEKQIVDHITFKDARGKALTLREAGLEVQAGIAEYSDLSQAIVTRAYSLARSIEEPQFDLENALEVGNRLSTGVQALDQEAGEPFRVGDPLDAGLTRAIQDLERIGISPEPITVKGIESSVTDQLRAIRSSLFDLKTPAPGEIRRQSHKQAAELYSALTNAIENPVNANPEFIAAHRQANSLAAQRFTTFEKLIVREASKMERPHKFAERLMTGVSVDDVVELKAILPAGRFKNLQNAGIDFLTNEQNLLSLKQSLDGNRATFKELFTNTQLGQLDNAANEILRLNQIDLPRTLQEQSTFSGVINQLVARNNTAGIKQLLDTSDPVLQKRIRAGMVEDIVNKVVKTDDLGDRRVDGATLDRILRSYRDSGAIGFLTVEDLKMLKRLEFVAPFLRTRADSGASLQAGEAVAGLRTLSMDAISTLIEHFSVGRIMTSKGFQRVMLGNAEKRAAPIQLDTLGAALAILATDLEADSRLDVNLGP